MSEWDIVVIGGGAAGVAAMRTLADAGKKALLVEASDRLGGRACTLHVSGMPLDMGAGWLHSAQHNPWVEIAEKSGFTVDRTLPRWREQWHELGFSKAEQQAARNAYIAFDQRMRTSPPANDRASHALDPDGEWNAYLEALSGFINSCGNSEVSVADYLAYEDAATETDWRCEQGYGALISRHAAGLPVALATPVTAIDRSNKHLRIETPHGTITAGQAIVTVSTNVLASDAIAMRGMDDIYHAAVCLPLGVADKLFLALDGGEDIDADAHLLGDPRNAITAAYTLRPFGRPVVECLFGGEGAREMEARGLDGAADFAIEELCGLLGSQWRKRLRLIAGSAWGRTDYILGGYSHALPGRAAERKKLATPIDERIRFAGEAVSEAEFSTAHGAYKTGVAAAQALIS
ncbi:FAD-dependent oxidoreductase [Sphingomonas sp. JC676]|uniref:flavin monoamine oxidase family protein n=1 Tax=Sphingomonas sp. JC676 TaxID=2768065 RepID=UPI00165864A1|nr:NAD(P)/FAD-dependent oxidoreductase [Sphingomonas sp. JC676]MBC9031301.1 FAD-dependent oxidoreductase [Sphingomonas sp. JC676]